MTTINGIICAVCAVVAALCFWGYHRNINDTPLASKLISAGLINALASILNGLVYYGIMILDAVNKI